MENGFPLRENLSMKESPEPVPYLPGNHPDNFGRIMRQQGKVTGKGIPMTVVMPVMAKIAATQHLIQQEPALLLIRRAEKLIRWHSTHRLKHPHHRLGQPAQVQFSQFCSHSHLLRGIQRTHDIEIIHQMPYTNPFFKKIVWPYYI